jgi:hypothetical protein
MPLLPLFFIVFGMAGFINGLMKVTGIKREDISKDSKWDKKHLSPETRYFIGRYYAGFQGVVGGVAAIALGLILLWSH